MKKLPPKPWKKSSPSCKRRCSKSSTRSASPTSWKKWTPAPRPICSRSCPEEQSDAILEEMEPEERQEVEELLEFDEDSAAGWMTTEFVYLGVDATVAQAVQALRSFDGDPESVTEIFLLDEKRMLRGAIPLARLVMAQPDTHLSVLAEPRVISCPLDLKQNDLAEMFDKYNLHALPVVDSQGRMVGVVQAERVISFLREKI